MQHQGALLFVSLPQHSYSHALDRGWGGCQKIEELARIAQPTGKCVYPILSFPSFISMTEQHQFPPRHHLVPQSTPCLLLALAAQSK